jgi:hypothetical protein
LVGVISLDALFPKVQANAAANAAMFRISIPDSSLLLSERAAIAELRRF